MAKRLYLSASNEGGGSEGAFHEKAPPVLGQAGLSNREWGTRISPRAFTSQSPVSELGRQCDLIDMQGPNPAGGSLTAGGVSRWAFFKTSEFKRRSLYVVRAFRTVGLAI